MARRSPVDVVASISLVYLGVSTVLGALDLHSATQPLDVNSYDSLSAPPQNNNAIGANRTIHVAIPNTNATTLPRSPPNSSSTSSSVLRHRLPIATMSLLAITKKAAPRAATAAARATRATSTAAAQTYSERQAALGRPVSPHVEIYAFPVTALSSITNRATGVALTIGFAGGAALAAVGADIPSLIYAAQDTIPGFAPVSKLLVAFPLTYHTLSAVRHSVRTRVPLSCARWRG